MKLLIHSQVQENYADNPETQDYWKFKGGDTYEIATLTPNQAADKALVQGLVDRAQAQITKDTRYTREWMIDWEIVPDDHRTEFEQSQLDYEGKILFPRTVLTLA